MEGRGERKEDNGRRFQPFIIRAKNVLRGKNSLHGRSVRCESQSRTVDSVGSKRFTILRLFHLGAEERNSLGLRTAARGEKCGTSNQRGLTFC